MSEIRGQYEDGIHFSYLKRRNRLLELSFPVRVRTNNLSHTMRCSCDITPTHAVWRQAMVTNAFNCKWSNRDKITVKLMCKALLPQLRRRRRTQPSVQQQVTVEGNKQHSNSDGVSHPRSFLRYKQLLAIESVYRMASNCFIDAAFDKMPVTQDERSESSLLLTVLILSALLYFTQECDALSLFDESHGGIRAEILTIADGTGRQRALTREQRIALEQMQSRPAAGTKSASLDSKKKQLNDDVSRVERAIAIMKSAEQARDEGDWASARDMYSQVITGYPDFALSERARIARALLEYQLGHVEVCLVELEDEEVAFRGSAEVHAALASVLYAERPERIALAEQQWDIATEFDTRYQDINWVKHERKWPPKMLQALEAFLNLR